MVGLIRTEVERAVGRMGFVREEELAAVRHHVERLERELNQRGDQASAAANLAVSTAAAAVPAATKAAGQAAALATDTAVRASKVAAGAARSAASQTSPRATASGTGSGISPCSVNGEDGPVKRATAKKAPAKKAPARRARSTSPQRRSPSQEDFRDKGEGQLMTLDNLTQMVAAASTRSDDRYESLVQIHDALRAALDETDGDPSAAGR